MIQRLKDVLNNQEDNYIIPLFWQRNESEQTLREYMGAVQNSNIQAVCLEARPHPDYCGTK